MPKVNRDDFFAEQEEQSKVKSTIVSKYFDAWANIMLSQSHVQKIFYLDLFAGPGRYINGAKSTPVMIIEKCLENPKLITKLVTLFNDGDPNNINSLRSTLNSIPNIQNLTYQPTIECNQVGSEMVEYFSKAKLIPTLSFIDPWGYKGLSVQLIKSVLKDWGSDCIFFFNYNRINMGITNDIVTEHMKSIFGEKNFEAIQAKIIQFKEPLEREYFIINELASNFNDHNLKYVLPFRFKSDKNRTSHYLIFVSKHIKGYSIMKEIMAKESSSQIDGVASFEYTPVQNSSFQLLFNYARPLKTLEEDLLTTFAHQTLSVKDVYEKHNVGTAFILKNYKDCLKNMVDDGKVECTNKNRRKNTMAETNILIFP